MELALVLFQLLVDDLMKNWIGWNSVFESGSNALAMSMAGGTELALRLASCRFYFGLVSLMYRHALNHL